MHNPCTTAVDFEKAFSLQNLIAAYNRARRGKQRRDEVARFGWNLEANLIALRREILAGTYVHGPYRKFIVSDSKRREIKAAPFRDRVMHQALVAAIEPIFEHGFIFDSYACRRGKGTHAGIARFEQFAHVSRYALMMDVSKYFASIDHAVLFSLLSRKVSDARMLALCRIVIRSSVEASGKGIPIGNLTSQLFANVYLNELDQYVKHGLRVRRYVRYMDDFAILHDDKAHLHEWRQQVTDFLAAHLGLFVHPKKARVESAVSGVSFLGFRIFPHHRLLRTSTVKRFVARAKVAKRASGFSENALRSWLSWACGANSHGLRASLAVRLDDPRILFLANT